MSILLTPRERDANTVMSYLANPSSQLLADLCRKITHFQCGLDPNILTQLEYLASKSTDRTRALLGTIFHALSQNTSDEERLPLIDRCTVLSAKIFSNKTIVIPPALTFEQILAESQAKLALAAVSRQGAQSAESLVSASGSSMSFDVEQDLLEQNFDLNSGALQPLQASDEDSPAMDVYLELEQGQLQMQPFMTLPEMRESLVSENNMLSQTQSQQMLSPLLPVAEPQAPFNPDSFFA